LKHGKGFHEYENMGYTIENKAIHRSYITKPVNAYAFGEERENENQEISVRPDYGKRLSDLSA
jgi:hypothetical protein